MHTLQAIIHSKTVGGKYDELADRFVVYLKKLWYRKLRVPPENERWKFSSCNVNKIIKPKDLRQVNL
jgi:hypothetical protein